MRILITLIAIFHLNTATAKPEGCRVTKEDNHAIATKMSTQFISQYSNIEEAKIECWWLHGFQESPTDYKTLSRVTGSDTFFSYDMHRDHLDSYQENEDEKVMENGASPDLVVCDKMMGAEVIIKISDSKSYEKITCKANIEVINKDFSYTEKLSDISCPYEGYLGTLIEKPGNYKIIVDIPGYSKWKSNFEVDKDICHVQTVKIDLLLDQI